MISRCSIKSPCQCYAGIHGAVSIRWLQTKEGLTQKSSTRAAGLSRPCHPAESSETWLAVRPTVLWFRHTSHDRVPTRSSRSVAGTLRLQSPAFVGTEPYPFLSDFVTFPAHDNVGTGPQKELSNGKSNQASISSSLSSLWRKLQHE